MKTYNIYDQSQNGDILTNTGATKISQYINFYPKIKEYAKSPMGAIIINQMSFSFTSLVGDITLAFGYIEDSDGEFCPDISIQQVELSETDLENYVTAFKTPTNKYKFCVSTIQLSKYDNLALALIMSPGSNLSELKIGLTNNSTV